MRKNNLDRLAVIIPVWNESFLLPAKLQDVIRLKPGLVVFTEGCFDDHFPPRSTDNTIEILEKFREKADFEVVILQAVRQSKFQSILKLYNCGSQMRALPMFFERLLGIRNSKYRSNQASTLNLARRIAEDKGMTHIFINDVDEFLSNDALECLMRNGLGDKSMVFEETTTFGFPPKWLPAYYEGVTKTWNGIYPLNKLFFVPTREPRFVSGGMKISESLEDRGFTSCGEIFHIKNLDPRREALSYQVGQRKSPGSSRLIESALPTYKEAEIRKILHDVLPG